jgi:hypothetical protein
MFPLPSFKVPSHTADPVRVAIGMPLYLLLITILPDTGKRNFFSA